MKFFEVYFNHSNSTFAIPENTLISDACDIAGYPLNLVCGGKGTCGKCMVTIRIGGVKQNFLACTTSITEDISIYLSEEQLSKEAQILGTGERSFHFNPAVRKIRLNKSQLKPQSYGSFIEQISNYKNLIFTYATVSKTAQIISASQMEALTLIVDNETIIDVQPGDTTAFLYGLAVDIGTTTVVGYLYNLNDGRLLGTYSSLNDQIDRGADVISRIMYCNMSDNGTRELHDKIINTINRLIDKAEKEHHAVKSHLFNIVLCGNSTMQHLFHGFNPGALGQYPFVSIHGDSLISKGSDSALKCPDACRIVFLPLLGGFVGADTLSVLLTVNTDKKKRLVIDLGTNGEIAVGNQDLYYVASTACGPALEGAGITFGMRGTLGAIERFEMLNEAIQYDVIGGGKPSGICGSGIVDIVAELLRQGLIDQTGKMNKKSDLISDFDGIAYFMVVSPENSLNGKGIYVTQKDIRQIQLAKSAIKTGCLLLLERYGIEGHELDEILLSGAFGNYINVKNAEYIGLIPKFEGVPVLSIGNGAGSGVQQYLLDKDQSSVSLMIKKHTQHVELASDPQFQTTYITNMSFGGTDNES
ncbi:MAG: Ferredoxin [Clostridiales bacterium 38_11]|nr:MAG: Ferredoxin [Clostridiales bacterium 38_11]HBH12647.1 ferredoxin [Clostridiales bacterium]